MGLGNNRDILGIEYLLYCRRSDLPDVPAGSGNKAQTLDQHFFRGHKLDPAQRYFNPARCCGVWIIGSQNGDPIQRIDEHRFHEAFGLP